MLAGELKYYHMVTDTDEFVSDSLTESRRLFAQGIDAVDHGNTISALSCFEKALQIESRPIISSYFAFCIAKERGQINTAILLCTEAISKEPENSYHYLNLGRVYLVSKNKGDAVRIFREGLNYGPNEQIVHELNKLNTRKPPVFPFLKRSNPFNKYLGIILKKLHLR
jgi:tetratricopeptide (TPR) repeat protein